MSRSDVCSLRRRQLLVSLGQLFSKIDEAFARGDYKTTRSRSLEVAELLHELGGPSMTRNDPLRVSGVQARGSEQLGDSEPGRRAS